VEEFFSTLVYLIPLAFFIFFRLKSARGNQQKGRAAPGAGKPGLTRPRGKVIESETPAAPKNRKARFRTRSVPAGPVREVDFTPLLSRILPKRVYEEIKKPPERIIKPAAEIPAPAQVPQSAARQPVTAKTPAAPSVYRKTVKGAGLLPVPARIEKLPSWKKAVVLAELLGKPKGW
jgi:hypothetical protein